MLSERHARALAGIERHLIHEDPALARLFDTGPVTVHRWWQPAAPIAVALVLMVACAVLGLEAATLACAALAVVGVFVHPRRDRAGLRHTGRGR